MLFVVCAQGVARDAISVAVLLTERLRGVWRGKDRWISVAAKTVMLIC